ncbi:MAG: D-glycerate dehydrogenase [bacterium]|nr:D-glycerate dehydrogenase [bacterium]
MPPSVAICAPLVGGVESVISDRYELRVHRGEVLGDERAVSDFIGDADAAITLLFNPVGETVLRSCPALRVVANCAVGFDNIDLDSARSRQLWVTNTPDVLTDATADLTLALILATTRRIVEADRFLRAGRFDGWKLDMMLGRGLQSKTLGIVGFGRIGRAVAQRALSFGMRVVWTDTSSVVEYDLPAERLDLDQLLRCSDVVSLHCPLTDSNRHLLDEERMRKLPSGAFVINTARGPLVDEQALVRLLKEGILGGAGLDVYESEPSVEAELLDREDVVLLPHIGSATEETRTAMAKLAVDNVVAVLEGHDPPTPVVRPTLR